MIGIQIEGLKRNNIGDVFQAIAVNDHLNSVGVVIDRENYSNYSNHGKILLIANGWYMHDYENFPPPKNIVPVYCSVHFSNSKILQSKKNREHFSKWGPVGARDRKTLWMLRAANIPSYYSGCFTIGINQRKKSNTAEGLLIVDGTDHPLSDEQIKRISSAVSIPANRISHDPPSAELSFADYQVLVMQHAEMLLQKYCSADFVVTTKIHCALPCMAMNVPVILIHPNPQEARLAAVKEYLPIMGIDDIDEIKTEMANRVNRERIKRKKLFINNFINEALKYGGNPVALSPTFKGLRMRTRLESVFAYIALRILYKSGLHPKRLEKVMGYLK